MRRGGRTLPVGRGHKQDWFARPIRAAFDPNQYTRHDDPPQVVATR